MQVWQKTGKGTGADQNQQKKQDWQKTDRKTGLTEDREKPGWPKQTLEKHMVKNLAG